MAPIRKELEKLGGEVTYENFQELVYANACFLEACRLHPAVPKNLKYCDVDQIQIPNGPMIHRGETVIWSDVRIAVVLRTC